MSIACCKTQLHLCVLKESNCATGMALGTGSALAHRAVDSVLGSRHPEPAQAQVFYMLEPLAFLRHATVGFKIIACSCPSVNCMHTSENYLSLVQTITLKLASTLNAGSC